MNNDVPVRFTHENGQPSSLAFLKALRPGDKIRWDDRKNPLDVLFVDRTGEYVPASMDHWEHLQSALLRGQRGAYFRLCMLNSGRQLRVYRLTGERWDHGTDSMGQPETFFIDDRLRCPAAQDVRDDLSRHQVIVDDLNPLRWSQVVEPSDPFGQIIVEPRTYSEDVPYPSIEPQQYSIQPDEVIGWKGSGAPISFTL